MVQLGLHRVQINVVVSSAEPVHVIFKVNQSKDGLSRVCVCVCELRAYLHLYLPGRVRCLNLDTFTWQVNRYGIV